ncbi:MAG TPA: PIG-L family deacetylase, partial [Verrucomicrobiales bacterium]|nr:PIG-L family deacetylase [Verrucomicrobiales bacterium]
MHSKQNDIALWVENHARLFAEGKQLAHGQWDPPERPKVTPDAPKALIFSPHPDDECIIAGLPLRLLKQSRFQVINVAVTQGSNRDRQAARLEELRAACHYM